MLVQNFRRLAAALLSLSQPFLTSSVLQMFSRFERCGKRWLGRCRQTSRVSLASWAPQRSRGQCGAYVSPRAVPPKVTPATTPPTTTRLCSSFTFRPRLSEKTGGRSLPTLGRSNRRSSLTCSEPMGMLFRRQGDSKASCMPSACVYWPSM